MANVRIKDLAATATTYAADDYLVVDGATNGTRKILVGNTRLFTVMAPSANLSVASGTETKLSMDTVIVDTLGAADTTNKRIVIPRAGTYAVTVSVRIGNASANISRLIGFARVNGSSSSYFCQAEVSALSGSFAFALMRTIAPFSASDYLELYGLQMSGSNQSFQGSGTSENSVLVVELLS